MDRFDRIPPIDQDDAVGRTPRARGRDSLFLMGRLCFAGDARTRDVRIRNLSEGGLMVEMERKVAIDTPLTLSLRGIGNVTGRVAWCAEGRIGIALDRPIDPKLARKPVGGGEHTPLFAKPQLR
jgi:hypothetical protein